LRLEYLFNAVFVALPWSDLKKVAPTTFFTLVAIAK
jgi:hypothetical protein